MFLGSTLIGGIALLNNDDYDSQLKRSVISGQSQFCAEHKSIIWYIGFFFNNFKTVFIEI